jgi:hypothetical protein
LGQLLFDCHGGAGGIKGGLVHGESDAHAAYPVSDIVSPADITATISTAWALHRRPCCSIRQIVPDHSARGRVIREIVLTIFDALCFTHVRGGARRRVAPEHQPARFAGHFEIGTVFCFMVIPSVILTAEFADKGSVKEAAPDK